jgi:environmental stress-induced protein Ves
MIVAIDSLPLSPWKNGGGLTREIAVGPAGAGIDDFDWRLTLADIQPGEFAFSRFPGIDRHTLVLGAGLSLAPAGAPRSALRAVAPLSALRLDGEDALQALLVGAPIQAFNLMLRRGCATGAVAAHTSATALPAAATLLALCCLQGQARARAGTALHELAPGTVVLLPGAAPGHVMLEMQAAHTLVLSAAIDHLGAGASPAPAPAPAP